MATRNTVSKTAVWVLLGLLILGLAGFGATSFSGTIRTVGMAGDEPIGVDEFARELQREVRAIEAQTGERLPASRLQELGLDQIVLGRLVTLASLDNEATQIGLSIGDENLQREIVSITAFQGLNGQFDPETYRFALQNAGLTVAEFEDDLRDESARTLLQQAIVSGVSMPDTLTDVIVEYVGARRDVTWARLGPDTLAEPLADPDEATLRAFYDENIDDYMLPQTKRITYAAVTPDMILGSVEVDEAALRARYEERKAEYDQPERRLVERLIFADEAAANDALAQLSVGGTTFELLVDQRGLAMSDIDLGDVTQSDLGAAGEAVFAAESGAVVGPLPTSIGPALFRINGILAAQVTSFEEARDALRDELAQDRARRVIEGSAQSFDDMLAGGATLEELAAETDMTLGQIDWTEDSTDDIAAYEAFRAKAAGANVGDYPEIDYFDDGGVFALRVNAVLDPRPEDFEAARERVEADWRADALGTALADQARALVETLKDDAGFEAAGLAAQKTTGLMRSRPIEGAPRALVTAAFEMEPGEVRVIETPGAAFVIRLDGTAPAETGGDMDRLRTALAAQIDQSLAQELFELYVRDVQIRARPQIDQQALGAVLSSFQ
jgi:peptidyl-prolyl cis-trans isomerase D